MSSSTTTTRLGRHVWTSIRDSVGLLTARLPIHQHKQLHRLGFSHSFVQPIRNTPSRAFHTSRWFSLPSSGRVSSTNVRKSCTSGGLLLLGLTSNPSSTPVVVATCTSAVADSTLVAGSGKKGISSLARQAWLRSCEPRSASLQKEPRYRTSKRRISSKPDGGKTGKSTPPTGKPESGERPPSAPGHEDPESLANSMSKYLHLPHMHRPTKEELLSAATGFWERLKVRFKWFSIRSMRPWNADEWGAFASWFIFGHLVWLFIGTTTFFSLVILTINTVFAQGQLYSYRGSRDHSGTDNLQKHLPSG